MIIMEELKNEMYQEIFNDSMYLVSLFFELGNFILALIGFIMLITGLFFVRNDIEGLKLKIKIIANVFCIIIMIIVNHVAIWIIRNLIIK